MRMKFWGPRLLFVKTTRTKRSFLPYMYLSIHSFSMKIFAKACQGEPQKQVSQFFTRQGGFHLASHQYFFVLGPAQRGVLWNPRNPPKSATVQYCTCANLCYFCGVLVILMVDSAIVNFSISYCDECLCTWKLFNYESMADCSQCQQVAISTVIHLMVSLIPRTTGTSFLMLPQCPGQAPMGAQQYTLIFHHTGHLPDTCTGRFQCVKIEIGGSIYGHGAFILGTCTLYIEHIA